MIDVSVIVPVYNAGKYLDNCIRSLCGQTLKNIEIIFVDDGSTDHSFDILKKYAQMDSRIKIIRQENAGAGAARNRGLEIAKGCYLSFLDADDFFEVDMLEKAIDEAKRIDADIVVFGADIYHEKTGKTSSGAYALKLDMLPDHRPFAGIEIKKDIFGTVIGWTWDKLFKRQYIQSLGIAFQEQRTTNDMLFVFSAFVKAERISTMSDVLAHYRIDVEGTLSVTREKSWMCFHHALIALKSQLIQWHLYQRFEQDFINYALAFSLWNLNTLKEPTRKMLYYKLKKVYFAEFGIVGYPENKFYSKDAYEQYRRIMKYPYWEPVRRILRVIRDNKRSS